jgi:hypothetical protein
MNSKIERQDSVNLPQHLSELLKVTPSGIAKLIAAWDGLSTESQIVILTEIQRKNFPRYLTEKVYIKAIESKNAYVRYLAARRFTFSSKSQSEEIYGKNETSKMEAIKKRIEEDSNDLVRYCLLEDETGFSSICDEELNDPVAFFELPQAARLAKVRYLCGCGERIAKLFFHAIDHELKDGTVSEHELSEILLEYVGKPEFREHYKDERLSYDGWGEYQKGKDISALWHLVPKLPIACAYVLVENLPIGAGLQNEVHDDVLKNMDNLLLEQLLWRNDVVLSELRKKVFFQSDEKDNLEEDTVQHLTESMLRVAAIAYNFDLTYQEFAEILVKPIKKKVRELIDLGSANNLSLLFYEAIHDVLFSIDSEEVPPTSWEYAEFARRSFERNLETLKGYQREKQLRELRLYLLATNAVPWKKYDKGCSPSGELEPLAEYIIEGDTWGTFMAFSTAWSKHPRLHKRLEKYLPSIDDVDEDKDEESETEIEVNQDHQIICQQLNRFQAELNKQRLFLYAVVVLLVWLLFRSW